MSQGLQSNNGKTKPPTHKKNSTILTPNVESTKKRKSRLSKSPNARSPSGAVSNEKEAKRSQIINEKVNETIKGAASNSNTESAKKYSAQEGSKINSLNQSQRIE
jgi:hypothetical protein